MPQAVLPFHPSMKAFIVAQLLAMFIARVLCVTFIGNWSQAWAWKGILALLNFISPNLRRSWLAHSLIALIAIKRRKRRPDSFTLDGIELRELDSLDRV